MSQSKSGKKEPKAAQQKAVALKYSAEHDISPVVLAAGYGPIAERIINIAEQRGVPVYRDDSAASMLCMLDVGSNIPPELYQVVAAIYCQILKTAQSLGSPGVRAARAVARVPQSEVAARPVEDAVAVETSEAAPAVQEEVAEVE